MMVSLDEMLLQVLTHACTHTNLATLPDDLARDKEADSTVANLILVVAAASQLS